jgi:D-alanyl-D-alanine carboxypeptidase/D-alanyl-D-alanine-endopeptidase (penicillin-binding protein 4)
MADVNQFSNNVMAQQVFLSLTAPPAVAQFERSREVLARWWTRTFGLDVAAPVVDNGSGLSRQERITAQALGRMLQTAYLSPVMPELMSSLPISGVDGTLRRVKSTASAHLKTGSLSNVVARAGYVLAASGKRYVVVAVINHANANEARAAVDALVEWAGRDQ